jgi:hypothetical protein
MVVGAADCARFGSGATIRPKVGRQTLKPANRTSNRAAVSRITASSSNTRQDKRRKNGDVPGTR